MGFNIGFNIGFKIAFNIGLNIGFNIELILGSILHSMDVYDTFDTRLKLLEVSFNDVDSGTAVYIDEKTGMMGMIHDPAKEAKNWMAETCRKLVTMSVLPLRINN